MAKPISETIAEATAVMTEVKDLLAAKAETTTETEPKEGEGEGEDEATETPEEPEEEEPKGVTKEDFDALVERVKILEDALETKDEETEALVKITQEATAALTRVNAYFRIPSNKAQLAAGEPMRGVTAEAVDTAADVVKAWEALPRGSKASREFYDTHKDEIARKLNK